MATNKKWSKQENKVKMSKQRLRSVKVAFLGTTGLKVESVEAPSCVQRACAIAPAPASATCCLGSKPHSARACVYIQIYDQLAARTGRKNTPPLTSPKPPYSNFPTYTYSGIDNAFTQNAEYASTVILITMTG